MLSSAGRRVGLLRAFRSSASMLGVDLEIFACDVSPEWSPACLESDYAIAVPPATSPEFIEQLVEYCGLHQIAFIVPTIDTELITLSLARERFAQVGTTVVVGSPLIVEMARDKLMTAQFLAAAGIPSPRTATAEEVLYGNDSWAWPLLAKPRHGSSSRGIHVVEDRSAVARLGNREPYVVQEMLYGREFTVNLFFDRTGTLKSAVPHERLKVRAGEVEKGVTTRDPELCGFARKLARALDRPFGAMCFQAIKSKDGKASLFEINARFGGGYPLAHRAGATFTRWLIEQQLDLASTANDGWEDSVVMLRYDDAVFV
ncbi:ATP-grasp domain-containing protein [Flavisphingomonas formosensis]|uniref:ATP-grasp domain-containing protein n=1 Tax=Flavisphingomonas formosensis TaxID=861534 RepID=UPI002FCCF04F